MRISGYINDPTEPELLALRLDIEYLMHHPHEPIMYSIRKTLKLYDGPYQ